MPSATVRPDATAASSRSRSARRPGWARIEVSDPGTGQWHPLGTDDEAEYGRGLAIVGALADKFGHDAGTDGQTVWAEVTWTTG